MGLAAGPDGNIWFTDPNNRTVDRMTTNGQVTAYTLQGSAWPEPGSIVAGADGNLWFTQTSPNTIGTITTDGIFVEYALPIAHGSPNCIARGPDGNLWFSEWEGARVGRITPQGMIAEFALRAADAGSPAAAHGIAKGPDGNLWTTHDGRITSITPDGTKVKEYTCPPGCTPYGITTGSDNMIWYVDPARLVMGRLSP